MRLEEYSLDKDYCGGYYLFHQLALIVVTINYNYKIVRDNFGFNYQPFVSKYQLINNICIKNNKLNDPLYKFMICKYVYYIQLEINTNYFSIMMIFIYIIIFYFVKKYKVR